MEYFIIEKWNVCYDSLNNNDVAGVLWRENWKASCTLGKPFIGSKIFAGNFWWANSSYIKTLPDIDHLDKTNRQLCESWIGMGPPKNVGISYNLDRILYRIKHIPENNYPVVNEKDIDRFRRSIFDEKFYLESNPNIAKSVMDKFYRSGYDHYMTGGDHFGLDRFKNNLICKYTNRPTETVIMTACVRPNVQENVMISDELIRIIQYIYSLLWWCRCDDVEHIIFCDGNNFDISKLQSLVKIASDLGKKLDLLSFTCRFRPRLGKGFGEGKIIEYALNNVKIETDSFYKITGRLCVENFNMINRPHELDNNVFRRKDTRFYKVHKHIYLEHLIDAYKHVNDRRRRYLEAVVNERLNNFTWSDFIINPIFVGQSGTSGEMCRPYDEKLLDEAIQIASLSYDVKLLNRKSLNGVPK